MSLKQLTSGMTLAGVPVLIVEKKVATAKNGKSYADLIVRDSSASLKCKIWNFTDSDWIAVGKVVDISGDTSTYNGELQFTASLINPNSSKKPEEFSKKTRFDADQMWAELMSFVEAMEEGLPKYIAGVLLIKNKDAFKRSPAATGMHNAWYGGLLEHTLGMCKLAKEICYHYESAYGEGKFSPDKVMFGILLHDIGKIWEYSTGNSAFPHTGNGLLANHITMGPAMVYEEANKWFNPSDDIDFVRFERERAHLMHLIAAHHGQVDWGSPVPPASLEAILVHHIDNLDTKFMHALELVEGKEGQIPGFSEKSWNTKTSYLKYNTEA